ncbi:MAG: hypothetical protein Q4E09_06660 [Eubacteriales bacterium]|nr:hypothetical protein [Eubacteriales bacterium]
MINIHSLDENTLLAQKFASLWLMQVIIQGKIDHEDIFIFYNIATVFLWVIESVEHIIKDFELTRLIVCTDAGHEAMGLRTDFEVISVQQMKNILKVTHK